MFLSQNQTLPKTPADPNQDSSPRTWKNWKHEHQEFKREEYSIVAFEDKILIVGGYLEDDDARALNLILMDPESQKFQIIPSVGDAAEICCNSRMSVCYWKDSKFVVFGGYDYYGPSKYSSAVGIITLKDLDSENPSAHWETMVTPTLLSRYQHLAYIHQEKMYVIGGRDDDDKMLYDTWCLDLTEWTWSQFNFTCVDDPRQDSIPEWPVIFHENKAYVFLWKKATHQDVPILELDFETRSSRLLPVPDIRKHRLFTKFCTQLVDGKIFFLSCPTNRDQNDPVKLQLWACDLNLRDWIEIPTTEPIPNLPGHLLYCNNSLVCYGKCEDNDPFFCELWSLPWKTPKPTSTSLTKTQQTLKDFFFEAPYSDISFEVESQIIKAHKWWLIQRNKFFANMFASGMAEAQASTIKITDMKVSTFKALLEFLYSDHVELTPNLALDLLQQSDKYSIGELKNTCEKHLIANIEPENYVALGNIAELIGALSLREAVVTFIAKNMKTIKPRKDFHDISDALLRDSLVKFIVK